MKKKNQDHLEFVNAASTHESGECLIWPYTVDKNGYGYSASLADKRVHRAVYILTHGRIESGSVVMHTCDNPACANPKHLKQGTQKQNVEDMHKKGRGRLRTGHAMPNNKGELHGKSRLDSASVLIIRQESKNVTQTELARRFGVSRHTINDVIHRRTWAHIP